MHPGGIGGMDGAHLSADRAVGQVVLDTSSWQSHPERQSFPRFEIEKARVTLAIKRGAGPCVACVYHVTVLRLWIISAIRRPNRKFRLLGRVYTATDLFECFRFIGNDMKDKFNFYSWFDLINNAKVDSLKFYRISKDDWSSWHQDTRYWV